MNRLTQVTREARSRLVAVAGVCLFSVAAYGVALVRDPSVGVTDEAANDAAAMHDPHLAKATFAGGCFWCMESPYAKLPGVQTVISGYAGGHVAHPTYEAVGSGTTGHAESVQVLYNPKVISYATLLEAFWRSIDPTDAGGQFVDRGSQYRPAIFYHNAEQKRLAEASRDRLAKSGRFAKPIVVEITAFTNFYAAEDYHQHFCRRSADHYHAYRAGSGRDDFLEKAWGKDLATPLVPVNEQNDGVEHAPAAGAPDTSYRKPPEAELKKLLTSAQYEVTQQCGTEPPFNNAYWDNKREGLYVDVVTGEPLFSSRDKFNSGTGWPSFTKPVNATNVTEQVDRTAGMERTEVRSKTGGSHLGHVFPDGPGPGGGCAIASTPRPCALSPKKNWKRKATGNTRPCSKALRLSTVNGGDQGAESMPKPTDVEVMHSAHVGPGASRAALTYIPR